MVEWTEETCGQIIAKAAEQAVRKTMNERRDEMPSEEEHPTPEPGPGSMEPLTPEEMEAFLARVRARAANFRPEDLESLRRDVPSEAAEMPTPELPPHVLAQLEADFFPELPVRLRPRRLVQGIIFDFDNTLARLKRPHQELMEEGAKAALAYMHSVGMTDLPEDFWESIIEARLFAQKKSDDEQEEHIATDTLSFLLQFFGYPASKMDLDVLERAVDLFYAPEMVAWEPMPGAHQVLQTLVDEGYRLALIGNFPHDRAFQRMVDYTGLRPYFDVCLSSAAVEWRKPARDIYDPILKRWDVEPYEVVCVGDSLQHDIAGGLELGARTVHCRMVPLAEDRRVVAKIKPDAVIHDLGELPELIQMWSREP